MKTVVFLSYYSPPCPTFPVAGERTLRFSRYLPQFGWRPVVITRNWDNPPRGPEEYNFSFPDPESQHSEQSIIIKTGFHPLWSEELWKKVAAFASSNPTVVPLRKALSLMRRFQSIDTLWGSHVINAFKTVHTLYRVKAIVSSVGPPGTIQIAGSISRNFNIPHIIDFRDPWLLQFSPSVISKVIYPFYKKEIDSAMAIIETSRAAAEMDAAFFKKKVFVIRNSFDNNELKIKKSSSVTEKFILTYTGTIYDDYIDAFKGLIIALKKLKDSGLIMDANFVFNYTGPSVQRLKQLISDYGVKNLFQLNNPIHPDKIPSVLASSNALFLPGRASSLQSKLIPAKLFRYMASTKPTIFFPATMKEVEEIIKDTNLGYICPDISSLEKTLQNLFAVWKRKKYIAPTAKIDRILNYSGRVTALKLSRILEEVAS